MKKVLLSAAVVASVAAFAQKKEIAAAYKAVDANDMSTAAAQVAAADAALGGKLYLLEPAQLEQYYYAKGITMLKSGKTTEGAKYLAKLNDLGKSTIYSGKDSSKNKVYFLNKSDAMAAGVNDLKEERYALTTTARLGAALNSSIDAANKAAVNAYNAKQYDTAGEKFAEAYYLLKAAGQDNGQTLYNAGLSYALSGKNAQAIAVFNDLIASGYTGVQTTYTTKDKTTGQVTAFDKTSWDLLKKNPNYTDFKTEVTPSIEKELYETQAALIAETGTPEEALAFLDRATKKFPQSARLAQLQGNVYYKTGKTDEFVANLKRQVAQNPNDAVSWYNLGVLQSKDTNTVGDAQVAFQRALSIDPKMMSAHQNLTYLMMGDDDKAVADLEAARKAGKMDVFNNLLEQRRARFAKALPYAEKWYEADPNNIESVALLKDLYKSAKNDAKSNEFKAKEAALKAAQK